jgi:hypothetical protein
MKEKNKPLYYGLVGAGVALAVILFGCLLVRTARFSAPSSALPIPSLTNQASQPLGLNDLSLIGDWMTFDYLDKAFRLPPAYLKTALSVTDARYPIVTIRHYARLRQISADSATVSVRDAIADYLQRQ